MRVLLAVLLVGIAGCGEGSSPPGEGSVPTLEGSQAKKSVERRETFTLKGHSGIVHSVCFSPNGQRIVSGGQDKTLKVWDSKTGQEMLTLKGHSGSVTSVSFSPDGKRIVSGSLDGTVKV